MTIDFLQNRDGEEVPAEYCEAILDKEKEICPYYRETRSCIRGKTCPMLHLFTGKNSGTRAIDKVGTREGISIMFERGMANQLSKLSLNEQFYNYLKGWEDPFKRHPRYDNQDTLTQYIKIP